jgi:hypothetical protein
MDRQDAKAPRLWDWVIATDEVIDDLPVLDLHK